MFQFLSYFFLLGLAGSFHCIGMCGAIALSLPVNSLPTSQKNIGIILYNIGRLISYSLIGLLFGLLGRTLYLGGFQQWLSIILGITIIAYFITTYFLKGNFEISFIKKFTTKLQIILSKYLMKQSIKHSFIIGILNGFLPCGMVYFALASSLATNSIINGMLGMFVFGLGTIPLMLATSHIGVFIKLSLRNSIKKTMPFFILSIGILFLLRGLNLNLPFISPIINQNNNVIICH